MIRLKSFSFFLMLVIFSSCATVSDDSVVETRKRASQKVMDVSAGDVEAEIQFGQELAARILGRYRIYNDEKATRYINLIGKGLAAYSPRPEIEFRFAILNTDIINAFAAPGGYIFVTKGTLKLIDNEAQLAGVLAHEIAHVTERHIVKELNIKGRDEEAGLTGFASILGGGGSDAVRVALTQMVDKATELLFEKGLKKEDELASDYLAVMLAVNAGYNPVAYKSLLEKIEKNEEGKASTKVVSATHPPYGSRVSALATVMEEQGMNDLDYADVEKRYKEYVKI